MNRDALNAWLREPNKTWRWNAGNTDAYKAVELRGDSLRWYTWSHDEGGGAQDEVLQPISAFLRDGPPLRVPEQVIHALRDHLGSQPA